MCPFKNGVRSSFSLRLKSLGQTAQLRKTGSGPVSKSTHSRTAAQSTANQQPPTCNSLFRGLPGGRKRGQVQFLSAIEVVGANRTSAAEPGAGAKTLLPSRNGVTSRNGVRSSFTILHSLTSRVCGYWAAQANQKARWAERRGSIAPFRPLNPDSLTVQVAPLESLAVLADEPLQKRGQVQFLTAIEVVGANRTIAAEPGAGAKTRLRCGS